jgi:hypothetical protein
VKYFSPGHRLPPFNKKDGAEKHQPLTMHKKPFTGYFSTYSIVPTKPGPGLLLRVSEDDPQDDAAMKGYREIGGRLFRAPVIVILCMDKALTTWSAHDIGLFSQTIMLAAREYGVDSIIA